MDPTKKPKDERPGHEILISDLEGLLQEARAGHFHSLKRYPRPMQSLHNALQFLAQRVRTGDYDSKPSEDQMMADLQKQIKAQL